MLVDSYEYSVEGRTMASTEQLDNSVSGYLALQLAILGLSAVAAGAVLYDVYVRHTIRKEQKAREEREEEEKARQQTDSKVIPVITADVPNGQPHIIPEMVEPSYQSQSQNLPVPRRSSRKASIPSLQSLQATADTRPGDPFMESLLDQVDLYVEPEEPLNDEAKKIEKQLNHLAEKHIELHHLSDTVATALSSVNDGQQDTTDGGNGPAAPCVQRAVRARWALLRRLTACADVHLKNSAESIKFHQMMLEVNMQISLTKDKATQTLKAAEEEKDPEIAAELLDSVRQDILETENIVQSIIARLREKEDKLVPVNLRTEKPSESLVSVALCSYKDKEADVTSGETLLLLDNSNPQAWKVKNMSAEEFTVPSTIILIPGPDAAIKESVDRLEENAAEELLKLWKAMAVLVIKTIDEYLQTKTLDSLPSMDSSEKYKLLVAVQQLLELLESSKLDEALPGLAQHAQQSKVKVAGADVSENPDVDKALSESLGKLHNTLEECLKKTDVPSLDLPEIKAESAPGLSSARKDVVDADTLGPDELDEEGNPLDVTVSGEIQHEHASAETSLYSESSQEVRHTFSIAAVLDAQSGQEVSMDEAIRKGLLDQANGIYINNITKEEMPIPEAMGKGLIRVESTKTMKTREQVQSVGIMTITITRETREFTVKQIQDLRSEEMFSVEEAVAKGLYNVDTKTVKNLDTNEEMSIEDAVTCGAAEVEYSEETKPEQKEVIKKTLSVSHVIDKKAGKRVTFGEAVERGLLDVDTSEFINNETGERVYASEALKKGFIRAKVIEDQNLLDSIEASRLRRDSGASNESGPISKFTRGETIEITSTTM